MYVPAVNGFRNVVVMLTPSRSFLPHPSSIANIAPGTRYGWSVCTHACGGLQHVLVLSQCAWQHDSHKPAHLYSAQLPNPDKHPAARYKGWLSGQVLGFTSAAPCPRQLQGHAQRGGGMEYQCMSCCRIGILSFGRVANGTQLPPPPPKQPLTKHPEHLLSASRGAEPQCVSGGSLHLCGAIHCQRRAPTPNTHVCGLACIWRMRTRRRGGTTRADTQS